MRTELGKHNGHRLRFEATMERFGQKTNYKGYPEKTILFVNVRLVETGQQVTDHIWFTVRKTLDQLNLEPGMTVRFDARVNTYRKGYRHHYRDYKLSHPTQFAVSNPGPAISVGPGGQLTMFDQK